MLVFHLEVKGYVVKTCYTGLYWCFADVPFGPVYFRSK